MIFTSGIDVACRLGVSESTAMHIMSFYMNADVPYLTREYIDIIFEAYIAADQMGLWQLR